MDATGRKVRSLVYGGMVDAYRGGRPLGVDPPEELSAFCECGHHSGEHHGPDGELRCSATWCPCERFVALDSVECPRCGDYRLRAGDVVCRECLLSAEEIAADIAAAHAPRSDAALAGDDSAGSPNHNRKV